MHKKDYSNLFRLSPKEKEELEQIAESSGALLKKERLNQGFTLEQVAEATTISVRSLRALEENDHDNLPAQTFVRGFISIYAGYLHLDPEELLARYKQQMGKRSSGSGEINAHAIMKLNPAAEDDSFSPYQLLAILVSAAVLFGLLYLGYNFYFTYRFQPTTVVDRTLPAGKQPGDRSIQAPVDAPLPLQAAKPLDSAGSGQPLGLSIPAPTNATPPRPAGKPPDTATLPGPPAGAEVGETQP